MKNVSPFLKKNSGFTLIELLVVISIIGILIALGVASYSSIQLRARDARRRNDVKSLQTALEQYYGNSNSSYTNGCGNISNSTYFPSGSKPRDPQTAADYYCQATATTYCSCATLEDTTGGNANAPSGSTCNFTASGTGGTHFCMSSIQ